MQCTSSSEKVRDATLFRNTKRKREASRLCFSVSDAYSMYSSEPKGTRCDAFPLSLTQRRSEQVVLSSERRRTQCTSSSEKGRDATLIFCVRRLSFALIVVGHTCPLNYKFGVYVKCPLFWRKVLYIIIKCFVCGKITFQFSSYAKQIRAHFTIHFF